MMKEASMIVSLITISIWSMVLGVLVGIVAFLSQGYELPILAWDDEDTQGVVWLSAQGVKLESQHHTKQPQPQGYIERADPNHNEMEVVSYRFFRDEESRKDCVELVTYKKAKTVSSSQVCEFY